jgi:hypothetical protein
MDEALDRAWRSATSPFDGITLRAADAPVKTLAPLLTQLVERLRVRFSERRLWRVEDWHAHDGWVTERRASSWDELLELCRSEDALIARAALDEFVALAFYTEPTALLLRIEVEDYAEAGQERMGAFDVTLPASDAALCEALPRELHVRRSDAKQYFDEIHGR